MRLARILSGIALVAILTLSGTMAWAQTRSPCAPGGPFRNQYPPQECGLRLGQASGAAGQNVTVQGDGFAPNNRVTIEMRSAPTVVATTLADATGAFSTTFRVPDAAAGRHTVAAVGANFDGTERELTADFTVTAAANRERSRATDNAGAVALPRTGMAIARYVIGGLALIAIGTAAVIAVRRRSSAPAL